VGQPAPAARASASHHLSPGRCIVVHVHRTKGVVAARPYPERLDEYQAYPLACEGGSGWAPLSCPRLVCRTALQKNARPGWQPAAGGSGPRLLRLFRAATSTRRMNARHSRLSIVLAGVRPKPFSLCLAAAVSALMDLRALASRRDPSQGHPQICCEAL
jgi:hypothetical protein